MAFEAENAGPDFALAVEHGDSSISVWHEGYCRAVPVTTADGTRERFPWYVPAAE